MMRLAMTTGVLLLCVSICAAQDDALPTLDELLNITPPSEGDAARPSSDDGAASTATSGETLEQLFSEMRTVSQRLGRDRDAGLDTQRIQQRILDKLDQVIRAAQQAQRSGGSGSPQNPQPQPQDQGASGNQQQAQGNQQGPAGNDNQGVAGDPTPAPDQADSAEPMQEGRIEWGNLPARLRDELLQGSGERFSPVYQDLTEAYYRRLAEDEQ